MRFCELGWGCGAWLERGGSYFQGVGLDEKNKTFGGLSAKKTGKNTASLRLGAFSEKKQAKT